MFGGLPVIPGVSPGALSPELLALLKKVNTEKPGKLMTVNYANVLVKRNSKRCFCLSTAPQ